MKKLLLVLLLSIVSCQSEIYMEDGIIKCPEDVEVGYVGKEDGISYKVVDSIMLYNMVKNNDNITNICTSKITNMESLFFLSEFNGDISKWDVSNVTNMSNMFNGTHSSANKFNGDISKWDVSSVTDMRNMFNTSQFNRDISNWDVSNVIDMYRMFSHSQFNGDISKWDVSNVTDMNGMFNKSQFNGDISKWDVSNVTNMSHMFNFESQFNGDISKWDVSSVTNMSLMFRNSQFKGNLSKWDVSNVSDMDDMFEDSQFNGDISKWVNKPLGFKNTKPDCKKVALGYLKKLKLANILWLQDEGYSGGNCFGEPNVYCGRVTEYIDGLYWTYDIKVNVKPNEFGYCGEVTGIWTNGTNKNSIFN